MQLKELERDGILQREYVESGKNIEERAQREESIQLRVKCRKQSWSETELVLLRKFGKIVK